MGLKNKYWQYLVVRSITSPNPRCVLYAVIHGRNFVKQKRLGPTRLGVSLLFAYFYLYSNNYTTKKFAPESSASISILTDGLFLRYSGASFIWR